MPATELRDNAEAIRLIDQYLAVTGKRELISAVEVTDLLLDLRLSLATECLTTTS